jgi:hypothetical protein
MSIAKQITDYLMPKMNSEGVVYITEEEALALFGSRKRYHTTIAGDLSAKCANLKESFQFEMVNSFNIQTQETSRYVKATFRKIDDDVWNDRVARMKEAQRKFQTKKKLSGVESTVTKLN